MSIPARIHIQIRREACNNTLSPTTTCWDTQGHLETSGDMQRLLNSSKYAQGHERTPQHIGTVCAQSLAILRHPGASRGSHIHRGTHVDLRDPSTP
eukprot:7644408-Pyramimonas_sp.AAC.1